MNTAVRALLVFVVLPLVCALGYFVANTHKLRSQADALLVTIAELKRTEAEEARAAVDREMALEQARIQTIQKVTHDAQIRINQTTTDVRAARDALARLRDHLTSGDPTASCAIPSAPAGSAPSTSVGELLEACATRYRDMAEEADRSYDAGLAAEQAYDAVTLVGPPIPK